MSNSSSPTPLDTDSLKWLAEKLKPLEHDFWQTLDYNLFIIFSQGDTRESCESGASHWYELLFFLAGLKPSFFLGLGDGRTREGKKTDDFYVDTVWKPLKELAQKENKTTVSEMLERIQVTRMNKFSTGSGFCFDGHYLFADPLHPMYSTVKACFLDSERSSELMIGKALGYPSTWQGPSSKPTYSVIFSDGENVATEFRVHPEDFSALDTNWKQYETKFKTSGVLPNLTMSKEKYR